MKAGAAEPASAVGIIEIAPKGFFSRVYTFRTPGMELVEVRQETWRERAEFEIQGQRYRLLREKKLGAFLLMRDDAVLARAEKPSAWRDRFTLELDGKQYRLQRPSMWRRTFAVFDGEQEIGSVAPAGAFSRRVLVQLPKAWTLPVQVFVFWLALIMWQRGERAAAAS